MKETGQKFVVVVFAMKELSPPHVQRGGRLYGGEVIDLCAEHPFAPQPIEAWHEEHGPCLWWSFPIEEPPYCGTPLDTDFPQYLTHFTWTLLPSGPIDGPQIGVAS